MPHQLKCRISDSTWSAIQAEAKRTGDSVSHVVERAVASTMGLDHHSIFQVSTTGALVQGVYQGCTRVGDLKTHGDFGLGTYEDLDGELVMLDGHCYRTTAEGVTSEVDDDRLVPFAVITRFEGDREERLSDIDSLASLERKMDAFRSSQNIFAGVRLDGVFERLDLRAACKATPGEDLVTATSHQSEFRLENVEGTLVGFWTPAYAKTLNVSGYHLHFISADRSRGGHLLNLQAQELSAIFHFETDFHMAIPETSAFLQADLRGDPSRALDVAEKTRKRD